MTRSLCFGLLLSSLIACSSMPALKHKVEPLSQATTYEVDRLTKTRWHLSGRLSIRSQKESWLTSLDWRHNKVEDQLVLSTSLGGVVAKLRYSVGSIVLSQADQVERRISELELAETLGYSPPVEHLKYWVRGVPNPALKVYLDPDAPSGVRRFLQDGWRVSLERFAAYNNHSLPTKVSLTKEQIKIKLVVDQWIS